MIGMNTPCELIVFHVLPMIKKGLADELIDNHDLSQREVARLLEVTDSVVSIYRGQKRSYDERMIKTKQYFDLRYELEGGAIQLINGIKIQTVVCHICSNIRESGLLDFIHEIVTGTPSNGRYANRFVVVR
jgi:uncharacterized protein